MATVIKVKHGETLRRFNARTFNGEFDLDFNGLRAKIIGLFKFAPDAELTLTYVDEDGDIVTLGDDEDLRDVVRQSLNPLRVTVKLSTERSGMSSAKTSGSSTGSSTPLRSPQVQPPLQNLSPDVLLKSVAEPVQQVIAKVCTDLASKIRTDLASVGTPSAQALADLAQSFSEMGLSYVNQLSDMQPATTASKQGEASLCTPSVPASSHKADVSAASVSENPSSRNKEVPSATVSKEPPIGEENAVDGNGGVEVLSRQFPGLEVLKNALESSYGNPPHESATEIDASKQGVEPKSNEQPSHGKYVPSSSFPNELPGKRSISAHAFPSYPPNAMWSDLSSQFRGSVNGVKNLLQSGIGNSSGSNAIPMKECPFSGMPLGNSSSVQYTSSYVPLGNSPSFQRTSSYGVQPRRNHRLTDNSGISFHRGVRCDGCGVHPITGPRFKSKVKDDYDLCSICFAQTGTEKDYVRIDRPLSYRNHPHSVGGLYDPNNRVHAPPPASIARCGGKGGRSKLDSRFILDVNILDGTIMAPSTPFTKIWRMRNNGSVVWPQGTQLVWIGGDKLSDIFSVDVEIASAGLPVDQELDVAVDFIAPERPGRYISYWRMASPTGQKFGQRVWVLVQVDASSKELHQGSLRGFNLNLPPVSSGVSGPEMVNVNPEPMVVDRHLQANNFDGDVQLVQPVVVDLPEKEQEVKFPINDSLLVGGTVSSPIPAVPASLGFYPIVDLSEVVPPVAPVQPSIGKTSAQDGKERSAEEDESLLKDVEEQSDVEETLLKELEDMGFKRVDLNKEILRLNEYDLEKSVDDLCGVSGWDPILEELREMGFGDNAMNKKLLKKNNGSIKRVVMDLLAEEQRC